MVICIYSLAISVPIKQISQKTKYEKASAVANRLLKELANETLVNQESQQDDIEYIPVINDLDSTYDEEYVDDVLPIDEQELTEFLEDEQEQEQESDEDIIPVIHTPIMDDSIMKSEND